MPDLDPSSYLPLVHAALREDVGPGDLTAQFFVPANATTTAIIHAKQSGILAGITPAAHTFTTLDPSLDVTIDLPDGSPLDPGTTVLTVRGSTRSILTAERTALNFLQHLSGVATLTSEFVRTVDGTDVQILDTRKTTPGWRTLEKAAVLAGGGTNHRIGLYDQIMVKDNHLLAGDKIAALESAITETRLRYPTIKIELEADTIEQVRAFTALSGVDIILLDNMSLDQLREAVAITTGTGIRLEASGGITLDSLRPIAETGIHAISSGALTHSAKALDLSLTLVG